jgi:outer membrane protein TolC
VQQTEISSLEKQKSLIDDLVKDNQTMLKSEERLFTFGESSIFLINTRENNLVTAQISQLTIENRYFNSNAELFKIMANPD